MDGRGSDYGRAAAKLALAVRRSSADIVHLVGTNALVFSPICRIRSKKHIVRHIFTSYDHNDLVIRPARWLVNSLFIDGYGFTTPWIGDWSHDVTWNTRKFLLRPPINCDLYRPLPNPKNRHFSQTNNHYTVLYMGPLMASRFPSVSVLGGLKLLLQENLDVRLVVLTSPSRTSAQKTSSLLQLAQSLGVDGNLVLRRADLTESERVEAYNSADLVIFPFVGPVPEKLADPPFGLLEAMACETRVLGTRVLSIPEVVQDGETGFLIPNATSSEICRGIARAFKTRDINSVGTRAREKIVELFSYSKVRKDLLQCYSSL